MMAEEIERAGYILTCFWQCVCMPSSWVVREVLQRALPIRRQFELQNQREGRRAYIAYRAFRGERFQEVRNYIDAFQSEGKLVLQIFVYHLPSEDLHELKAIFRATPIPVVFLSFRDVRSRRASLKRRIFITSMDNVASLRCSPRFKWRKK